jgi:hypothetical protein
MKNLFRRHHIAGVVEDDGTSEESYRTASSPTPKVFPEGIKALYAPEEAIVECVPLFSLLFASNMVVLVDPFPSSSRVPLPRSAPVASLLTLSIH